ncbi:hypothetical protein MMC27_002043 [Xylographa pallens]|nr:hypothetical protein [Xylographa pallens]
MPFCLPHPSRIPTGDTIVTLISRLQPSSLMTVPSILEDISLSSRKSDIQALVPLDFVAIGGGPMKLSVAEKLSGQGVKLLNHFGATELGPLAPIFQPDADYDWHYVRLRTDMGLELERLSPEGEVPQRCRLTGHPFGWNFTFELADELECNPLHPDTEVKIIGRKDDLIVLANGEKILPRILEEALSANQAIRTVVAFGDGQFEIGVIVEPTNPVPAQEHERYIDEFWQMVVLANELMDDHARVSSKTAIIVADKKIPRSDKDSVMRKEAYALYEPKIQAVYEKLNNGKSDGMLRKLNMDNLEDGLKMMVQECLYKKLGARAWTIDDDLFDLGMDSLQATRLRRMLIASTEDLASGHGAIAIPKDFVYYHPSVSQMAIALREPIASDLLNASRQQLMTDYMRQYAFSSFYKSSSANPHSGSVVLLTGSTGNLGAFFLEILCKNPSVRRIICLGRESKLQSLDHGKSGLQKRQERVNLARGIFLSEAEWSKTEFLHWNMGEELLGLTNQEYSSLSREVTHIFHGAWPMDFGRKLQSFKPQIRAMRSLIELGLAVNRANHYIRPRIVLASSIAVVGQYPLVTKKSIVPELPMNDPSVAIPMGYAEAKWVCEKIMEDAATSFPNEIEPIVIRIGQISGSQRAGFWSQAEHIPALIKASQSLGKFPILKGTLSWLPVDMAATILSEITFAKHLESHNIVYHLENPVRQPWPEVSTVLRRNLKHLESNLSLIPFGDWLSAIANDGHSTPELLEFFRDWFLTMGTGILVLDVERAKRLSSTLRNVGPVKDDVVESYIESWRNAKYIS